MIKEGDDFWTSAPDGSKNVHVVIEKCGQGGDCKEDVIRSQSDDTTTNNLDYIPC